MVVYRPKERSILNSVFATLLHDVASRRVRQKTKSARTHRVLLLGAPRGFAFYWSYPLDTNAAAPRPITNEFMSANNRTLRDEDGDYSDWIELANTNWTPITNLAVVTNAEVLLNDNTAPTPPPVSSACGWCREVEEVRRETTTNQKT